MVSTEELFIFEDIELGEDRISARLDLPETIPFFRGHFPQNPILPGVSMVDASFELLRKKFPQKSINNIQLKRSKFMKMIKPGQSVLLTATSKDQEQWKVVWESELGEGILAQLNLIV